MYYKKGLCVKLVTYQKLSRCVITFNIVTASQTLKSINTESLTAEIFTASNV